MATPKKPAAAKRKPAAKKKAPAKGGRTRKPPPKDEPPSVVEGVKADLAAIAKLDPDLAKSGLAQTARRLAESIDKPDSATSRAMCSRALLDTMDRLRELAPEPDEKEDPLDQLSAKRAQRQRTRTAKG